MGKYYSNKWQSIIVILCKGYLCPQKGIFDDSIKYHAQKIMDFEHPHKTTAQKTKLSSERLFFIYLQKSLNLLLANSQLIAQRLVGNTVDGEGVYILTTRGIAHATQPSI